MTRADFVEGRFLVLPPALVGEVTSFFTRLRDGMADEDRLLVGFDFPIGLPAGYAKQAIISTFKDALLNFGNGKWSFFFDVCEHKHEISLERPFYPFRPGGTKREHLVEGIGVPNWESLLRLCERKQAQRAEASSLFWTLGGQQVGRAAISGWRDILIPALHRDAMSLGLWPFDGQLCELLDEYMTIAAETYPAEAYRHLGFPPHWTGKRNQEKRRQREPDILTWAKRANVVLDAQLIGCIQDGYGSREDGEDPFDATIGALAMIDVVNGRREEGFPKDKAIQQIEGWIFGQAC